MSQEIESIVSAIAQMTHHLSLIQQDYLEMRGVIQQEKEIISARDLEAHEKHVKRKSKVGRDIVDNAEKIMNLWRRIKTTVTDQGAKPSPHMANISDLLVYLQDWIGQLQASDFAKKILYHAIDKLKERLDAFAVLRDKISPEIEANAYLVERLLQRHHDFRRFIQQEIDGSSAVYNARGSQDTRDPLPMLRVRA